MTWWKKKPDDVLEWTVSEAGFDDAPEIEEPPALPKSDAPAAATQPPILLRLPWRSTVLVVAPAALILLGVWAWSQWNLWQTGREIEQTMSREPADPPRPLGFLERDEAVAPRVLSPIQQNTDTLRADIAYAFLAPDEQRYTFATPRFFFRSADESWQPTAPPDTFPGEIRQYKSQWFMLNYYAADAELVEQTLIPYLERTLERACTLWRCAPPARLTLTDLQADEAAVREAGLSADEPLLFWLLADGNAQTFTQIAAPHTAGYPVDAASRDLWLRTLALRAFSQIFLSADLPIPLRAQADDPWLSALAAIVAADLGLESPTVLRYGLNDETDLRQRLTYDRGAGQAPGRAEQAEQRRNLLAFLNRFARQWPEVNRRDLANAIFRNGGPSPFIELLRHSLQDRRPFAEWVNDWRELLGQPVGEVELPPADLMLMCITGPRFYEAGELKPLPPFDEWPAPAYTLAGWSPDGRYLSLGLGWSAAVLDTQTGLIRLPDDPATATTFQLPLAWASDSVLVYLAVEAEAMMRGGPPDEDSYQLRFFDLAEPARNLPPLTGVGLPYGPYSYLVSPDNRWAALLYADSMDGDSLASLDLLPALGGERQILTSATNALPVWSPDSRMLAFAHWEAARETLVLSLYTIGTGQTRVMWDARDWELTSFQGMPRAQLAWSGDGQWLALAVQPSASSAVRWLGLIAPDGSSTLRLDTPQRAAGSRGGINELQGRQSVPGGTITALAFSNNGRYLALSGSFGQPQLLIYDVVDRGIARTIPSIEWPLLQWSPDDRQLLLSGRGVAVLNDPLDPEREPETLADSDECQFGAWKP